jgi:hypothetical protein
MPQRSITRSDAVCQGNVTAVTATTPASASAQSTQARVPSADAHQRLRHLQDRHRALELAHRGPDARGAPVRRAGSSHRGCWRSHAPALKVELFGSARLHGQGATAATSAMMLGLEGEDPATVDVDAIPARIAAVGVSRQLKLLGPHAVDPDAGHRLFHRREKLPLHSNGMRFSALVAPAAPRCRAHLLLGRRRLRGRITRARPRMAARRQTRWSRRTRSTRGEELLVLAERARHEHLDA